MKSSVFSKGPRHWYKIGLGLSFIVITSTLNRTSVFAQTATTATFDLNAELREQSEFYNLPYPSDFRIDENGRPDLSGFPVFSKKNFGLIKRLKTIASDRTGFPTTAAGYFRFNQPLAPLDVDQLIPAETESPILLIDIDRNSPERGHLFPVVASTPAPDPFYVPEHLLAVSPFPGIVLKPNRQYAYVIRNDLKDVQGSPIYRNDGSSRAKNHSSGPHRFRRILGALIF